MNLLLDTEDKIKFFSEYVGRKILLNNPEMPGWLIIHSLNEIVFHTMDKRHSYAVKLDEIILSKTTMDGHDANVISFTDALKAKYS